MRHYGTISRNNRRRASVYLAEEFSTISAHRYAHAQLFYDNRQRSLSIDLRRVSLQGGSGNERRFEIFDLIALYVRTDDTAVCKSVSLCAFDYGCH